MHCMKKAKLVFVFQKYILRLFVLNLILYQQDDIILKTNSNISLKTSEEKTQVYFFIILILGNLFVC